jgi:hypothetical protein
MARPKVLPDEDPGCASRLHRREMFDVVGCQQFCEFRFDGLQFPRFGTSDSSMASTVPSSFLVRIKTSMRGWSRADQGEQPFAISPVIAGTGRELDNKIIDWSGSLRATSLMLILFVRSDGDFTNCESGDLASPALWGFRR